MTKQKRLIRIETSLTPKQAVLLWLRQEHRNKTWREYARFLIQLSPSAAPRVRVEQQVVDAVRGAMKGQEPSRINQAVRQAQMYTDFLLLLVSRANAAIFDDSRSHWLQIALLYEQLRNATHSENEEKAISEWADHLREFASELLSLQEAIGLIERKYFEGECILQRDASEALDEQTKTVKKMMAAYDHVATEAGQPELTTNCDTFQMAVVERASERVGYITALARSKMLDDFGEAEAANAVLRPYILGERFDLGRTS